MRRCCPGCTELKVWTGRGLARTARRCGPWAARKRPAPILRTEASPETSIMCLPRPMAPLAAMLTRASRHDVTQLLPLLDMEFGWTGCRRCAVNGAYPSPASTAVRRPGLCSRRHRQELRGRHIVPVLGPTGRRTRQRVGSAPLGGRADRGLAASVPRAAVALLAPR